MACSRWLRRGKFENCGEDWCPGRPPRPACRGWIQRPAILLFLGLKMAGRRLVSRVGESKIVHTVHDTCHLAS
jgi:hypothetical protein